MSVLGIHKDFKQSSIFLRGLTHATGIQLIHNEDDIRSVFSNLKSASQSKSFQEEEKENQVERSF
jgi:hypothetical protein